MQTSQKLNEPRQAARAAESNDHRKEAGLMLTTTQSRLLVIGILILFGTLLFFGYKDWQRQRQMRQEFEEHLRAIHTSKADEEKGSADVLFRDTHVDEKIHTPLKKLEA